VLDHLILFNVVGAEADDAARHARHVERPAIEPAGVTMTRCASGLKSGQYPLWS
jgi:hypothetical protein